MDELLSEIGDKLRLLQSQYAHEQTPCIFDHRFRPGPTLTPLELARIEDFYAIRLPRDYAAFLCQIGNGGAGPGGYGITRFGLPGEYPETQFFEPLTIESSQLDDEKLTRIRQRLGRPFPLTESYRPTPMNLATDEEQAEYARWGREVGSSDGCLFLGLDEWNDSNWLVVNGPQAGSVWVNGLANDGGVVQLVDAENGFLRWYAKWLDDCIAAPEWVGRNRGGKPVSKQS